MTDAANRSLSDSFRAGSSPPRPETPVAAGMLRRFNPYDFSDAQVRAQATGRGPLLRRILAAIADNAGRSEPPNQHLLVLGPRGMGKSFLVRWVQAEVNALDSGGSAPAGEPARAAAAEAPPPIRFVRLSEEQLNVSAPELLLDEIRRVLQGRPADSVRVRWRAGGEPEWNTAVTELRRAIAELPGFGADRGLVVVSIENFDLLIEEVFDSPPAQSRLRALLADEPRLMLLTTATRPPDDKASKRLFLAFERLMLAPWTPPEFVAFYRRAFRGGLAVTAPVEAKILALSQFLGGSPRLAVLMGDILHSNDALSAVQTLDQLVDELTPYYQDRILNRLKPKPRYLLDEMLRGGEPCSQSELAERVGAASQPEIAQPFQALLRDQIVVGSRASGGRKGLYRVADRVFAHFYRKRYLAQDSHSPLAGMVDFLEAFYTQQELLEQIERLSDAGELDKAEILAQALRQGADWHGASAGNRRRVCRRRLDDAVAMLGAAGTPALLEALRGVDALVKEGAVVKALDAADAAEALADGPTELAVVRIVQGSVCSTLPGDPKAVQRFADAVEQAERAGHPALQALALEGLAGAEALTGEHEAAERHFQQADAVADKAGDRRRKAWVAHNRLWLCSLTERWEAFDDIFERSAVPSSSAEDADIVARMFHPMLLSLA
jgi:tetratricopeptide (TPR) repeat protein